MCKLKLNSNNLQPSPIDKSLTAMIYIVFVMVIALMVGLFLTGGGN
jgi:hypothetical protein